MRLYPRINQTPALSSSSLPERVCCGEANFAVLFLSCDSRLAAMGSCSYRTQGFVAST